MAYQESNKRVIAPHSRHGRSWRGGFSTLALLVSLPLVLTVLASLSLFTLALRNYTVHHAECRRQVWRAQSELGRVLERLLALNPRATRLRAARRLAEAELKAAKIAVQPEWIVAAKVKLDLVIAQQAELRRQQSILLFQARAIRSQADDHFLRSPARTAGLIIAESRSATSDLAVRAEPPRDLSPNYVLEPNFAVRQALSIRWRGKVFKSVHDQFIHDMAIFSLDLNGQCAATLKAKEKKWQPQLIAAKS